MSIEQVLIAQSRSRVRQMAAAELIEREASKGCTPWIAPHPLALEPPYAPLASAAPDEGKGDFGVPAPEPLAPLEAYVWLRVRVPPRSRLDWLAAERFLKQLARVGHRVVFLVVGNSREIRFFLGCHEEDLPALLAAFYGQLGDCTVAEERAPLDAPFTAEEPPRVYLSDFYPAPPYNHHFTRPAELKASPLDALMAVLAQFPATVLGLYQVIFQPTAPEHNWHANIQGITDLEFMVKLSPGLDEMRFALQSPSGDLRLMSAVLDSKAHNDKPFFATAWRLALLGHSVSAGDLAALQTVARLFQHGGRPLNEISGEAYTEAVGAPALESMLRQQAVFRPGFLLNSEELSGLVHVPATESLAELRFPIELENQYSVRSDLLDEGTPLGTALCAGGKRQVCLPGALRQMHAHVIGATGVGKSLLIENMILHEVDQGDGIAVLDPHGDLVNRLLERIPEEHMQRVVYMDPADPEWIPLWNPLGRVSGNDPGRIADDLVGAFKTTVTGWGDRLEHLLRSTFLSLLQMPQATLFDAAILLTHGDKESKQLRDKLLPYLHNETLIKFWKDLYPNYKKDEMGPPQHKLSKLLSYDTVQLMLSQPENRISFQQIMNDGKILLVDLSRLGGEVRNTLGAFILALLHMAALSRSSIPTPQRRAFHVYCDEAHRFATDAIEDLLAETRKYNVSLTLAHQYLSQFSPNVKDAIATAFTTAIFRVNASDANFLLRHLQGRVEANDLLTLGVGEAIVRIGNEIVRLHTFPEQRPPDQSRREFLIAQSRKRYCRHIGELRVLAKQRRGRYAEFPSPPGEFNDGADYPYDEFD